MLAYYLLCLEEEEEEEEIQSRLDPRLLSDEEFLSFYRINKQAFNYLCDMLKDDLIPGTNGFCVELRVLSTLKLLGSGSFQDDVGEDDFLQMSQPTISRNLNKVVDALLKLVKEQISFPMTDQDQNTVKKGFYKKCGLPNVLGVIDSFHVEIYRPNVADHVNYINRKGVYSLNVLLTCDADGLITNVVARWPGGVKDSDVWKQSNLRKYVEESNYSGYFIGDNSFSCDPWLVTPYKGPKKDFEIAFNFRIRKAMTVMERVIRSLKARFRCLHKTDKGMNYYPEKSCRIITACCVLHNITLSGNTKHAALPDALVESRWPLIDLENTYLTQSEQGIRLREELALSLDSPQDVRSVEEIGYVNSEIKHALDLLNNCDGGYDTSNNTDVEYRLVCAELEKEERALREQASMGRDDLAELLIN